MRRLLFMALLGVASISARPAQAQMQVSDADRAAARDLFFEGVKLQNDGKFAEALDRFDRAQRVFSAPTHLLHIAECQIALGRLVEGAETYRTLTRTPLPPNSPAAFTQAQQQGTAELAQVEPRIPLVKIDVMPSNVTNLQVAIDGTPMNSALVGVMRPIDPGAHKVSVAAPGYTRQDVQFTIREREQKPVPIALQAAPGTAFVPGAVVPIPPPGPPPTQAPMPPPYQPAQPTAGQATQPQAPGTAEQNPPGPVARRPSSSFLLGVKVGGLIPGGSEVGGSCSATGTSTGTCSMSNVASGGGGIGVEGGFRFATHWGVLFGYEHGFLGTGSSLFAPATTTSTTVNSSVGTNLVDFRFFYVSNPFGVGFYAEVGAGYRWFSVTESLPNYTLTGTDRGAEFSLGGGVFVKAGNYFRIIPKINVGAGSFANQDVSCSGTCNGVGSSSNSITNTATHTFVFLGASGYFNLDLGHQ